VDFGYVAAGAVSGLLIGLTGVGGGALMTPVLILVFGVAPTTAVATDLWFAAITKVAAVLRHRRQSTVNWPVVRRLWLGSLPAALITAVFVSMGTQFDQQAWMTQAIGLMVCLAALGLLFGPWLLRKATAAPLSAAQTAPSWQAPLTVCAGGGIGGAVALTSVGAGSLGVVLLMAIYRRQLSPQQIVLSDLVHAIPLAVVGGLAYAGMGLVDGRMLGLLLLGSLPAAWMGSHFAHALPPKRLQAALAGVLLLVGMKSLFF
jgi:hypothetical protein